MFYVSNIYYKVLNIINVETKKNWTFKEVAGLIVYLIFILSLFVSTGALGNGIINIFSIGGAILGLLGMIVWVFVMWRKSSSREDNLIDTINRISRKIKEVGIDSSDKIDMLIDEINQKNASEKENRKDIVAIITVLAKYTLIVPISFLAGFAFKDQEVLKVEVFFQFVLISLTIFFTFLGLIIMNTTQIEYFFTTGKRKREKILSYLLDIKYVGCFESREE